MCRLYGLRASHARPVGCELVDAQNAHVRRATVGEPALHNTHPFRHGEALLVHNGHVARFERGRRRILEEIPEERHGDIRGTTDSEHILHLLSARAGAAPDTPRTEVLGRTARDLVRWSRRAPCSG